MNGKRVYVLTGRRPQETPPANTLPKITVSFSEMPHYSTSQHSLKQSPRAEARNDDRLDSLVIEQWGVLNDILLQTAEALFVVQVDSVESEAQRLSWFVEVPSQQ